MTLTTSKWKAQIEKETARTIHDCFFCCCYLPSFLVLPLFGVLCRSVVCLFLYWPVRPGDHHHWRQHFQQAPFSSTLYVSIIYLSSLSARILVERIWVNKWMNGREVYYYLPANKPAFSPVFFCSQQTSHGFCWCRSVLYQAPVFYAAPFFCLCELNCVGQFFCRCFFVFPVLAAKVAMCRFPHTAEWLARLSINQLQFFHLFFFFSHSCVDFSLTFQLIA